MMHNSDRSCMEANISMKMHKVDDYTDLFTLMVSLF